MNGPLMFAWLAQLGLITWRDFKKQQTVLGLPPPGDYFATFIVYGGLLAVGEFGPDAGRFAALAGWSLVLASLLNLVDPTFATLPGKQNTSTSAPAISSTPLGGTTPTNTTPTGQPLPATRISSQ